VWVTVIATQLVVAGGLAALVWWPSILVEAAVVAAVGVSRRAHRRPAAMGDMTPVGGPRAVKHWA
jgi:hypothetical protein